MLSFSENYAILYLFNTCTLFIICSSVLVIIRVCIVLFTFKYLHIQALTFVLEGAQQFPSGKGHSTVWGNCKFVLEGKGTIA